MIRELHIRNCALIEDVAIEFDAGLSVFTGETGAGKSILVGAIGLVLGDRASADFIRSGTEEADVSAVFELSSPTPQLKSILDEHGIGFEEEQLIIRRRVTRSGKNRIHVNEAPVSLSVLKMIGDVLVDFHGQHEHQSLLNETTAQQIIDTLPGVKACRSRYDAVFEDFRAAKEALSTYDKISAELLARREMLEFQFQELNSLDLRPGEEEEANRELTLLSSSADRLACVSAISRALSGGEEPVQHQLGVVRRNLEVLIRHDPSAASWSADLEGAIATLSELETYCASYAEKIQEGADPDRIDTLNARLSRIQKFKKKYQLSAEELIERQRKLKSDLDSLQNTEADRAVLEKRISDSTAACLECGKKLSAARRIAADDFDKAISVHMGRLGFVGGSFLTRLNPYEEPGPTGLESVEFTVRTNPGEPFLPLSKTASGGEISRLMLAIKTVMASHDHIPVLIFDEIDTGVGGMLANEIARSLSELSASHQVLCITHLHQIAACANFHYRVRKDVLNDRTTTNVDRLDGSQRVDEIARMLGGESDITRKHAKELLKKRTGE